MVIIWLAALVATLSLSTASSVSRNRLDFLAVVQNPSIRTRNHRIHASSSFDLSLDLYHGLRKMRLSLEPNHDIIPDGATLSYLGADGTIRSQEPIQRQHHKVFRGTARMQSFDGDWYNVGWARINVLADGPQPLFEGAFSVNHDHHHIQLSSTYNSNRHMDDPLVEAADDEYMVVWRDSDIAPDDESSTFKRGTSDFTCTADQLTFNSNPSHPVYQKMLRRDADHWGAMPMVNLFGKRQIDTQPGSGNTAGVNLVANIGQTSGCPNTRKVALVGVATDCTYTGTFPSKSAAHSNVITQMNSASSLWESSFNISLGLQNLTVSEASCPGAPPATTKWNQNCQTGADIQERLNLFSEWRGTLDDHNSHWTLLTNCNSGSSVGLGWLGQACVTGSQSSNTSNSQTETFSGANIVAKTPTEWQVIS